MYYVLGDLQLSIEFGYTIYEGPAHTSVVSKDQAAFIIENQTAFMKENLYRD